MHIHLNQTVKAGIEGIREIGMVLVEMADMRNLKMESLAKMGKFSSPILLLRDPAKYARL